MLDQALGIVVLQRDDSQYTHAKPRISFLEANTMRCLRFIGWVLGALLPGCVSPYEPHETVTVKISGVSSEGQQERIKDKLKGMTDGREYPPDALDRALVSGSETLSVIDAILILRYNT